MAEVPGAARRITEQVTSWPGVRAAAGQRGELAFTVAGRQLGHLHGDRAAHLFFPEDVWERLRAAGRIEPHPVFPDRAGPAARRIESGADVDDVVALLRVNYDRLVERHGLPEGRAAEPTAA
jgi:hypothetical protein